MAKRYKGIYEINGVRWERFDLDLFKAAHTLHQMAHGLSDLSMSEERNCLGFVQARIEDWVDSEVGCEFFDEDYADVKRYLMEFKYADLPRRAEHERLIDLLLRGEDLP